jgi:hypothetical protein
MSTTTEALTYLAQRRRKPLTRAEFDTAFPGMFQELYADALIFDWRDSDSMFRVGITDKGRAELAWRTL